MFDPERVSGANAYSSDALATDLSSNRIDELKPVDNMHHFMEYIYGPIFTELKELVAEEPADKATWGKIKSRSLILAETTILLAKRHPPKDKSATWNEASVLLYKGGSDLYQAARKKDFAATQTHFGAMINGCKKCHEEYRK